MTALSTGGTSMSDALLSVFPVPQWLNPFSAAIDISQSSIKYLTLRRDNGKVFPDVFYQITVPEGVINSGEIIKPEQLVQILKGISSRFGGGTVFAALPEEFAYVFPITVLNINNEEQVRTAVEFSLSEHVPLPATQIVYDWAEIPTNEADKSRYCSVTGYDVKNSEQYRDVLERAGFIVHAFEPEVHAAARACLPETLTETGLVLLIDFGKTRTGITAVWNRIPISTSTIEFGGAGLTNIFSEFADGDVEKSELLKYEHGLTIVKLHPDVSDKIEAYLTAWMDKVNAYIEYLSETHTITEVPLPKITRAVLCGGEVAVPGLLEWVSAHLTVPVTAADVWQNMFSYDDFIPEIERAVSFRLATTVGLALRNLHQ